jgi:hypothetical protein
MAAICQGLVACFNDDFEACIAHLRFPLSHRRVIRTTDEIDKPELQKPAGFLFGTRRRFPAPASLRIVSAQRRSRVAAGHGAALALDGREHGTTLGQAGLRCRSCPR